MSVASTLSIDLLPWSPGELTRGPMCHPNRCRGYGDPSYGVTILGIAPGENEVREGRPFVGAAGQIMNSLLRMCEWPRDHTYCTNLICWWNNKPTPEQIAECSDRLEAELAWAAPKLIITLGVIATSYLTGLPRDTKNLRGSVLWDAKRKCYVLSTTHPAAPLRSQLMDQAQDIIRDFDKIPMVLGWPMDGSIADITYDTIDDPVRAQAVLDRLPDEARDSLVWVDIESSSTDVEEMDIFSEQLLRVGLGWTDSEGREHIYTLRPESWRGSTLRWPVHSVRWGGQNFASDTMAIWRHLGVKLPIDEDTMLESYCADERPGNHGLKTLAREYQGAGFYDNYVKPFKRTGTLHLADPVKVDEYNSKDIAYTMRTHPILVDKMRRDETEGLYRDLLIPGVNAYRDFQYRGINIDFKKLVELAWQTWMPRSIDMVEKFQDDAEHEGFQGRVNLNSNPQLAKLFFQIIGIEPTKRSKKTGAPSVDKDVLDAMNHPLAGRLRACRTIDRMIEFAFSIQANRKFDGLIHPSALLHNTRTGRRAYHDPAVQTIPKPYTVGAEYGAIREVFIPHDPETHIMMEADLEQAEVWVAWWFSQDPLLLEHLRSGDVHTATAEIAFNIRRGDFSREDWEPKRQNAKKIRFGLQYGEGAERLASPPPVGIGGTVAEAQKFIDNIWSAYTRYRRWVLETESRARKEGEVRLPSGRVMRFPLILDHKELRQAVNAPIQGTVGDDILTSAIELPAQLVPYNSYVLLDIHDSLWIEVDKQFVPEVAKIVTESMTRPKWNGFPVIPLDLKIGPNMGQLEKYKP